MKARRGTRYLSAWRQTVSDWGSTPPTASEDRHRAVEHAQAALDLDREVDVAGRVDDVDPVLAPEAGGRAAVMVIPRSCSCSIQSIWVVPSWTSPIFCETPV